MAGQRRYLNIFLIVLVSFVLMGILFQWATQYPYGWADDDAYFYAQVAYNIGTEFRSTFDGMHITDGYHLLWAGFLSLISFIVSWVTIDKSVHLYFFMAFSMGLSLYIAFHFGKTILQKCILFGLMFMGKFLMETPLLTMLILFWIIRFLDMDSSERSFGWLDGVLIALIPLTRIDASVMIPGFLLFFLLKKNIRDFIRGSVALGIGMGLHFGIMIAIAGSPFSVSALIKSHEASWGIDLLLENLFYSGPGYSARAFLMIGLAVLSLVILVSNRSSETNRRLFFVWLGISLFSFIHIYLSWLRSWYYLPGHILYAFIIFRADIRLGKGVEWMMKGVKYGLLSVVIVYAAYTTYQGVYFRDESSLVRSYIDGLDDHVPPEESIFQRDGSGYVGYFAHRNIINGDGLMNDHEFARLCIAGRLDQYFEENGICYIIHNRPIEGDLIDDYCGLNLRLADLDRIYSKKETGFYRFSHFVLFRRKTELCRQKMISPES